MLTLSEKHYTEISSLIKCQQPDLELISREGSSFQTWKLLICLHSNSFSEIILTQDKSRDIIIASVDLGQDDLEMLLETIHYDLDVNSDAIAFNEAASVLGIGKSSAIIRDKNKEFLPMQQN